MIIFSLVYRLEPTFFFFHHFTWSQTRRVGTKVLIPFSLELPRAALGPCLDCIQLGLMPHFSTHSHCNIYPLASEFREDMHVNKSRSNQPYS